MNTESMNPPSITFLNSSGDITISWDKDKEDAMLDLVRKKMDEGYTFFLLKPRAGGLLGNKKVPATDIEQIRKAGSFVAPDALAKSVVMNLGDADVSQAVSKGSAKLISIAKQGELEATRPAANAAEVLGHQSLAFKRVVGG
jgi:ribosomal protein L12E/L44/L45/RPP1/RPP2